MQSVLDAPTRIAASGDKARGPGGKYLIFQLDNEEYGVATRKVREILALMDITRAPRTPDFADGVINLRGKVVPAIDLRSKLGLARTEYNEQTCIIVVDVGVLMGIIVDAVSEVNDIPSASIAPPPRLGGTVDTSLILGMGSFEDQVKILLDIDKVLARQ